MIEFDSSALFLEFASIPIKEQLLYFSTIELVFEEMCFNSYKGTIVIRFF